MTRRIDPVPRGGAATAVISGSGIAALTLAHLLTVQGWRVGLADGAAAARPLQLLVTAPTAALLTRLWGAPDLFDDAHPIAIRRVAWEAGQPPVPTPAPGFAIAAAALVAKLAARLDLVPPSSDPPWRVDARPGRLDPDDPTAPMAGFGTRRAWLATATLRPGGADDTAMIERRGDGWLFVLPLGGARAAVQCIARQPPPPAAGLVAAIPQLDGLLGQVEDWSGSVPAMPRLRREVAAPGWLAVGEAALGFDPISGDGTGHALRGVVLASTTLQAIVDGAAAGPTLADYRGTLRRAMAQHLKACLGFYTPVAPAWHDEVAAMAAGLAGLEARLDCV